MVVDNRDPEKLYLEIKAIMDKNPAITITDAADYVDQEYKIKMNGSSK